MTQILVSWVEATSAEEITVVEAVGTAAGIGASLANAWITSIERDDDLLEAESRVDLLAALPRTGYPTIPVREM